MNKYKVAYISGDSKNINYTLQNTIEEINRKQGVITQIVQSQSTNPQG